MTTPLHTGTFDLCLTTCTVWETSSLLAEGLADDDFAVAHRPTLIAL